MDDIQDMAVMTAIEWYEDQMNRIDLLDLPLPEDIDFDQAKEIFWELEEEVEQQFNVFFMHMALEDAFNYITDQKDMESLQYNQSRCEHQLEALGLI